MNNNERSAVLKRLTDTLKKHFTVVLPDLNRPVLEQLVYSICLENASFSSADEIFLALTHNFFDWNEVRVSSSRELAETMKDLPEPAQTGLRLKRILHQIFDRKYNFDLEEIRKMGMKQVNEFMEKIENVTPFNVSYLMQTVLDRHSIPVSSGEFEILDILGLVDSKDREANTVAWLERVIEKKAGLEFFSLIHQLGALYTKNPYGRKFQEIMVEIDPSCKNRLPKRRKDSNDLEIPAPKSPEAAGKATASGKTTVANAASAAPEPEKQAASNAAPAEKKPGRGVSKKFESKPLATKLSQAKNKKGAVANGPSSSVKEDNLVPSLEKKAVEKKAVEKKNAEKPVADKKSVEKKGAREVKSDSSQKSGEATGSKSKSDAKSDGKTDAKSGTDSAGSGKSGALDKPGGKAKPAASNSAEKESAKSGKSGKETPEKKAKSTPAPDVPAPKGKEGPVAKEGKAKKSGDKTNKANDSPISDVEKEKAGRKAAAKDSASAPSPSGTRRKPR